MHLNSFVPANSQNSGSQPLSLARDEGETPFKGRYVGTYCGCLGCNGFPIPNQACQQLPADGGCPYGCNTCKCFDYCRCSDGYSRLQIKVNDVHIQGSPFLVQIVKAVGKADKEKTTVMNTNRTLIAGVSAGIFVQARDKLGMDCARGYDNFSFSLIHQHEGRIEYQHLPAYTMDDGLYSTNITGYTAGQYAYQAYLSGIPISGGEIGRVLFGTDSSVTLDVSASSVDGYYTGYWILMSYNGIGQLTSITDYSGLSKRCQLSNTVSVALNSSFQYELFSPVHVVSVVPNMVSGKHTTIECYSDDHKVLFLDGSNCGVEPNAVAAVSFIFLIIYRDSYSNALTSGVPSDRLTLKITYELPGVGSAVLSAAANERWCSEQRLLSAEQCSQQTSVFQCDGQPQLYTTGQCGGSCDSKNCSFLYFNQREWHDSEGSVLVKYSGKCALICALVRVCGLILL